MSTASTSMDGPSESLNFVAQIPSVIGQTIFNNKQGHLEKSKTTIIEGSSNTQVYHKSSTTVKHNSSFVSDDVFEDGNDQRCGKVTRDSQVELKEFSSYSDSKVDDLSK